MQGGSDSASGPVTVWMTVRSRTCIGALDADHMIRLAGSIAVLEARRPDELTRRFRLRAESPAAVSRLAYRVADLLPIEEVRIQRCIDAADRRQAEP